MPNASNLRALSDDDLLRRLSEILRRVRRDEADLIAHIAEVDARGLYAREAAPSMFAYCVEVLHLSEPEAGLRIHVARTCLKHPALLEKLREGELHLSGISLLAPVLTPENRETLLKRAIHQSKRRIEEIVAEVKPRPDTPAIVRQVQHRPDDVESPIAAKRPGAAATAGREHRPASTPSPNKRSVSEHRPEDVGRSPAPPPAPASRVEPLAPTRFRVHFTASAELRDKLERLQALMRSSVPDGDLGQIIDEAVTEKLERLEAKRFAKTKRSRKSLAETDTRPKSRHIPAAVKRSVHERDGGRCTYRDRHGRRCAERHDLEYHHRKPFGRGGDHSPKTLCLMCRTHNAFMAERDYGKEVMARYRRSSSQVGDVSAVQASVRQAGVRPRGPG